MFILLTLSGLTVRFAVPSALAIAVIEQVMVAAPILIEIFVTVAKKQTLISSSQCIQNKMARIFP